VSRRDNAHVRCRRCHLHDSLCVCALLPRIETRTRLLLLIHLFEARKPSNTGLLAAACLPNHRVILRGHEDDAAAGAQPLDLGEDTRPVLLYPALDAIPLDRFVAEGAGDERPITLVVPDGNWRQAGKVRQRVPGLSAIPCVVLPPEPTAPTTYRLRSEPHPQGMATMEAIARALGLLEGAQGPSVRAALEEAFLVMVERTLWSRGLLPTEQLTRPIPAGIQRHDPRGPHTVAAERRPAKVPP
jgi:DTW domain-containing protein YfiP